MVGKKKIAGLMAVLLTASIFGGCSNPLTKSKSKEALKDKKVVNIGISQIVEHPALDSARKGFIEGLKAKGFEDGKNIKIDYQNAQGEMPTAQTIAQNFASKKQDIILAIATPCAQAAYNTTKDIPIVVTAVTDPVKSGLVKSIEKPGTNVTGTSDAVPINEQFELLKNLFPKSKKIGIMYNTSESNSEVQVENAKKAASKLDLEIVTTGITNVNDVPQALNSLLGKIDVLYIPTDNVVASSMPLISKSCFDKNIPIIGAEEAHVKAGALATTGIDYYKLGEQTANVAVEIINGKDPKDIPISTLNDTQLVINTDAAKKLNVKIPEDLLGKAEKVTGGVN